MTGILVFVAIAVGVAILIVVIARRPPGSAERSDVHPEAHARTSPDRGDAHRGDAHSGTSRRPDEGPGSEDVDPATGKAG